MVLVEFGIDDILVVGIVKCLEEIWLSGELFFVILSCNSEVLFFI